MKQNWGGNETSDGKRNGRKMERRETIRSTSLNPRGRLNLRSFVELLFDYASYLSNILSLYYHKIASLLASRTNLVPN